MKKIGIVSILLLASMIFSLNLSLPKTEVKEKVVLILFEIKANTGNLNQLKILGDSLGYNYTGIHWPNQSIPVNYYISSTVPSSWSTTIQQSFQVWEDIASSYMDYTAGNTTIGAPYIRDYTNVVSYGSYDGPGNVLACAAIWASSGIIVETDITFDSSENWSVAESCPANAYDVQNCMTHEVGHTLMLWDLYNPTDSEETMNGYTTFGETKKRTLNTGDVAGASLIYPCDAPPADVHDVAITNMTLSKTSLIQGEQLTGLISAKNNGDFDETLNVTISENETPIDNFNQTLAADDSLDIPFTWNTSNATTGQHNISCRLEITNDTKTEDNFSGNHTVTIAPRIRDLSIVAMKMNRSVITENSTAYFNVTVKNNGNSAETFTIRIYANNTWLENRTVYLPAEGNITLTFQWDTTGLVNGKYLLSAVVEPLLGEINPDDNIESCLLVIVNEITGGGGSKMPFCI